jgi:flagellar basal body rod protein FlgG
MVYGLYQSAAALQVQEYRQAITANNLANVDTPGFKPDRITFQDRLSRSIAQKTMATRHPVLDGLPGGVFESPVYTDHAQGPLTTTDAPLDLALEGEGLFKLRTDDGIRYSRDGRLVMDRDGRLRHAASGGEVLDDRGRPLLVDSRSRSPLRIDERGQVSQGADEIGRLAIVRFADAQALGKTGANLFSASGKEIAAEDVSVVQGAIEESNVDPVATLVDMIQATRAYQINATILTLQDDSLGRVVNELGRIG